MRQSGGRQQRARPRRWRGETCRWALGSVHPIFAATAQTFSRSPWRLASFVSIDA